MSGYIAMARRWQEHDLFEGDEFSRRDAWAWLIANAAWKDGRARVKSAAIDLRRGELCFSQRFLAMKWGWSKSRVDRFLALLRDEGMIETRTKIGADANHPAGQGQSIITICNYDKYQSTAKAERGNVEPPSGATAGQQRGKEEEGNNTIPIGIGVPPSADPVKLMFDLAIAVFGEVGHPAQRARSIVGRMRDGTKLDAEIIALLMECKANRKGDPVAFVQGGLKHRAKPAPGGSDDATRNYLIDEIKQEREYRERQQAAGR